MARIANESAEGATSPEARPANKRRGTLQDIATAAGFTVSTVSDALKETGRVSPATREKVRRIAAEQKYIPNLAARALVTGRTGIIAIVSRPLDEPYYAKVVHLLEDQIESHNYKTLLLRSKREVQNIITENGYAADGFIAVDMYHIIDGFSSLGKQAPPCVFFGTFSPSQADHVSIDLSAATVQALQIMLDAGCKRIAYVVSGDFMADAKEVRAQNYLSVMNRANRAPEIINLRAEPHQVRENLKAHIRAHGAPDALLCQNDEMAMATYRALLDLGLRIPQDVLLVGCDGLSFLEYFDTPISTIAQPLEEACALAWQFLQRRLANPAHPLQQTSMPAHLIARESLI